MNEKMQFSSKAILNMVLRGNKDKLRLLGIYNNSSPCDCYYSDNTEIYKVVNEKIKVFIKDIRKDSILIKNTSLYYNNNGITNFSLVYCNVGAVSALHTNWNENIIKNKQNELKNIVTIYIEDLDTLEKFTTIDLVPDSCKKEVAIEMYYNLTNRYGTDNYKELDYYIGRIN